MNDVSSDEIVSKVLAHLHEVKSELIIDIGASEGHYNSNSFYLINHLGWSAVLVEPMERQFAKIERMYLDNPKVECVRAALTDHDGVCEMYIHRNDGDGTMTDNHGSSLVRSIDSTFKVSVPAISFHSFCAKLPSQVGILSIDTEGYDMTILSGILSYDIRPQAIITEKFFEGGEPDKDRLLERYGYKQVVDTRCDNGWILEQ